MSYGLDSQNWGSVSSYSSNVSSVSCPSDNIIVPPPPPKPARKNYGFHVAAFDVLSPTTTKSRNRKPVIQEDLTNSYPYDERDSDDEFHKEGKYSKPKFNHRFQKLHNNVGGEPVDEQIKELNERTLRIETYCLHTREDLETLHKKSTEILELMKAQKKFLHDLQVEQMRREMNEMTKTQQIFQDNKEIMNDLMESVKSVLNRGRETSRSYRRRDVNRIESKLGGINSGSDFFPYEDGDDCFTFDEVQ